MNREERAKDIIKNFREGADSGEFKQVTFNLAGLCKIADYIEAEIEKAKREVAENFFRHEAVGEYDPADYLRNILKQSEVSNE